MGNIYDITLKIAKENFGKWASSVRLRHAAPGIQTYESQPHVSKKMAWNDIQKTVNNLDFENDTVYFNESKVSSLKEVEDTVNAIAEKVFKNDQSTTAKQIKKNLKS
jgi:virulence-associated protein VapD